nr:MAG TPA: hypothetical protein [Caudoviricetes sp.]
MTFARPRAGFFDPYQLPIKAATITRFFVDKLESKTFSDKLR